MTLEVRAFLSGRLPSHRCHTVCYPTRPDRWVDPSHHTLMGLWELKLNPQMLPSSLAYLGAWQLTVEDLTLIPWLQRTCTYMSRVNPHIGWVGSEMADLIVSIFLFSTLQRMRAWTSISPWARPQNFRYWYHLWGQNPTMFFWKAYTHR